MSKDIHENPHTIKMTAGILVMEFIFLLISNKTDPALAQSKWAFILCFAMFGAFILLIMCTEKIRAIESRVEILYELLIIAFCSITFFAFQYYLLQRIDVESYGGLTEKPIDYFYNSAMIFFFNPLIVAKTNTAQLLILLQTVSSFIFGVFILQNIGDFKGKK